MRPSRVLAILLLAFPVGAGATGAGGTPIAIAALRRYLDDPDYVVRDADNWPGSIPLVRQKFFYRRAFAANLLREMGAAADVSTVRPALERSAVPTNVLLLAVIGVLLPGVFARRISPMRRLARSALFTTVLLSAVSCVFWVRSNSWYDEVLIGTRNAEHELSSCFGRLQYLYVADRPTPYGPQRVSLRLGDPNGLPDHIGRLVPATDVTRLGLNYQMGVTPVDTSRAPPRMNTAWPYRLIRIPWWMPMTLFALPTLLVAAVHARGVLRRRVRRRRNLCPACGYDLRGLPAGARCPECGVAP